MIAPKPEPTSAEEIKVTLKPVLSIQPKYYLAVFYGLIVLGLLFYFCLWEGLSKPGTLVTIHSQPEGASVHFQGKLYGHTPLTVFFPQGQGEIQLTKASFDELKVPYTSGNNLFLSGFFPKKEELAYTLPVPAQSQLEANSVREISRWSSTTFTDDYPAPPLFTHFVQDAIAQGWDNDRIKTFLSRQLRYVTSPQLYADFGKACGLWTKQPPESLEVQSGLWEHYLAPEQTAQGRLIFWLLINQPKVIRSNLLSNQTAFFSSEVKSWKNSLKPSTELSAAPTSAINANGYRFLSIPKGAYRWGFIKEKTTMPLEAPFQIPVNVKVADFWLSDTETTQAQFAEFIKANPSWAPSNRQKLIEQGLADEGYLIDWNDVQPPKPSAPVSEVSWYAAQAYVDWLNGKISLNGKKVSLPTEVEWEWAAREAKADKAPVYVKGKANSLGLAAMQDGVWEWTDSSWAPGDQLVRTENFQETSVSSYFRTVKGGSSENNEEQVEVWDRGAVPAASSNPYLGFRIALKQTP